jgi:3-oxoacyl-[acyl-carrier protein] reductase
VKGLAGRPVIVTGAASGIGRATCERLVAEGAPVALVDRDAALDEVARRLAAAGGRVLALRADVSVDAEIGTAIAQAAAELGGLRGLVTSAGIFDQDELRPLADVDPASFARTLDVNLRGTFLAMRYALPHLVRDGGAIVTIASTAGLRGHGFGAGYTASKGGVVALTRLAAVQYGAQRVRANCVCPGFVSTGMTAHVAEDPEYVARIARGVPLGRIGQPEDLAGTICYLLSDDAAYVTGQIVTADGGATAT